MAAQVVKRLPEGDDWIYELKFDGYRALIIKDEQRVELRSRKNKDLTGMYRGIAAAGSRLNADQAVVDGEIVALDAQGSPSFQALQHRGSHPGHQIVFYAFDLLHLNGTDLTGQPLLKRRARLPRVLDGSGLLASEELPGAVSAIVEAVRGLGTTSIAISQSPRKKSKASALRLILIPSRSTAYNYFWPKKPNTPRRWAVGGSVLQ